MGREYFIPALVTMLLLADSSLIVLCDVFLRTSAGVLFHACSQFPVKILANTSKRLVSTYGTVLSTAEMP